MSQVGRRRDKSFAKRKTEATVGPNYPSKYRWNKCLIKWTKNSISRKKNRTFFLEKMQILRKKIAFKTWLPR